MKRFLGPMCAGFLTEIVMFSWLNASSQGGWSDGGVSPVPLIAHFPAFVLAELPLPAPLFMATLFAFSATCWSFVWYGVFRWAPTIRARFRPRTEPHAVNSEAESASAPAECKPLSGEAAPAVNAEAPVTAEAPVKAEVPAKAHAKKLRVRLAPVAQALRKAKGVAFHGRVASGLRPLFARVARLCPARRG